MDDIKRKSYTMTKYMRYEMYNILLEMYRISVSTSMLSYRKGQVDEIHRPRRWMAFLWQEFGLTSFVVK